MSGTARLAETSSMKDSVVFVVDDDVATLKALTRTLASAGWEVRSFYTPESFLDTFDTDTPGCIVLDLRMPGLTGLDVQERLAERGSRTPIIFVTAYADVSAAVVAMKAGAVEFMQKPISTRELLDRVRQAVQRDTLDRRAAAESRETKHRLALLTPREHEVLELILNGKLNKQIAAELGIAVRTVEVHRQHIMGKMRAETGIELARLVLVAEGLPSVRRLRTIHNIPGIPASR